MYEAFVHTRYYRDNEPIAKVYFELPEKELEELEETEYWQSLLRFLMQKRAESLGINTKAHLIPTKIADGYVECDVRLVAGPCK